MGPVVICRGSFATWKESKMDASSEEKSAVVTEKVESPAPKAKKKPKKGDTKPAKTKKLKLVKPAKKAEKKSPRTGTLRKNPGPAMEALANKIKTQREPGECKFRGCSKKTLAPKGKWCAVHKKEVRAAQLAANNATWHDRAKKGLAGHHVVYRNQATVWALQNKDKAHSIVKNGRSILKTVKALDEVIRKTPVEAKQAARAS